MRLDSMRRSRKAVLSCATSRTAIATEFVHAATSVLMVLPTTQEFVVFAQLNTNLQSSMPCEKHWCASWPAVVDGPSICPLHVQKEQEPTCNVAM
mmetsp:Transcript_60836/g.113767  ORF Transcript_60836/g.113767 Transcript_60836/m.113767 type:complete len:95 (-) Transcript_60836:57-341(-)